MYRNRNTLTRPHQYVWSTIVFSAFGLIVWIVGPIAGGFISKYLSWRWAYWILLIGSGPLNIAMILFMQESNHPTILEKKTKRLKNELRRHDLHSHLEMRLPPREVLARSIVRPVKVNERYK